MIHIEAVWMAVAPIDLRTGMDSLLTRVVDMFGTARAHHAYCFTNRQATRLKVLVHDGLGVWLATRRLHQGHFSWKRGEGKLELSRAQFDALILGLPWRRIGEGSIITLI